MDPTTTVFPYPGGKSVYASWIVDHIPQHRIYVEPFGGAAGVLVNKPPSEIEIYNDADESLVNFFEILRDRGEDLRSRLEDQPYSRAEYEHHFDAYHNGETPDDPVAWAAREFYLRYSHFGARLNVGRRSFRTSTEANLARRFANAVDALDHFTERFRGVVVENADWEDVVDRYDEPNALFYIDPPYPDADKRHYHGHATFDQSRVVDRLDDIEGRWLLSYGQDPPDGLNGYRCVERETRYTMNNGQKSGDTESTERLFMNFDHRTTPTHRDGRTLSAGEW